MSLKVNNLQKDGDASKEYLLLQATEDLNLHDFAVVDRTFDAVGKVSNLHRHFYRFPKCDVKQGQFVALFTGKGIYGLGKTAGGAPLHKFYWGSEAAIWNDAESEGVEILKVSTVLTSATGNTAPIKKDLKFLRPPGLKYAGK